MFKNSLLYMQLKKIFSRKKSKEALLTGFYEILLQQKYKPAVIYDIGANKGTWTQYCLNYFPNADYFLFEPQPNLKTDLDKNLGTYPKVQVFSVGVGKQTGKLLFTYHDRDDSCTFQMTAEEAASKGYRQVEMPIVDLDSFIKENHLPLPDLLKIDAEGLDIEVLEGAKEIIKEHVTIIMVEVGIMNRQYKNSAIEVLKYMDTIDFTLFDITDLNRPFSNRVLWLCEFVFIKKGSVLDKNYSEL